MKQTRIKKIDGDAQVLRDALVTALRIKESMAVVNPVTGHVVLKGHWKPKVEGFLAARRF